MINNKNKIPLEPTVDLTDWEYTDKMNKLLGTSNTLFMISIILIIILVIILINI